MTKRTDSRIDQITFKDEGCHLHSACLTCPRERCYLDEPPARIAAKELQIPLLEVVR